jgi:hypothetical protein
VFGAMRVKRSGHRVRHDGSSAAHGAPSGDLPQHRVPAQLPRGQLLDLAWATEAASEASNRRPVGASVSCGPAPHQGRCVVHSLVQRALRSALESQGERTNGRWSIDGQAYRKTPIDHVPRTVPHTIRRRNIAQRTRLTRTSGARRDREGHATPSELKSLCERVIGSSRTLDGCANGWKDLKRPVRRLDRPVVFNLRTSPNTSARWKGRREAMASPDERQAVGMARELQYIGTVLNASPLVRPGRRRR